MHVNLEDVPQFLENLEARLRPVDPEAADSLHSARCHVNSVWAAFDRFARLTVAVEAAFAEYDNKGE